MPRISRRSKAITCLTCVVKWRLIGRAMREFDDDEDSLEDMKDLANTIFLSELRRQRYLHRRSKYRKSPATDRFKTDMNVDSIANDDSSGSSEMPWLLDDEFLQKYRMTRSSFRYVLDLIKDNSIFYNKRKQQAPVSH
jgi:hypothetical protein